MLLPNAASSCALTLRDIESGDLEATVYRFTFPTELLRLGVARSKTRINLDGALFSLITRVS